MQKWSGGARRSLREAATSLFHKLRHKLEPILRHIPVGETLLARKLAGSFQGDASHWGQHVTGGHIVTMGDMGKGFDGSTDVLIVRVYYLDSGPHVLRLTNLQSPLL